MNLLPEAMPAHDSRGLIFDGGWTRSGATLALAPTMDPCPTLAPTGACAWCKKADAEIVVRWRPPEAPSSEIDLSALRALVEDYQLCRDMGACFDRRRDWEAAQRQQAIKRAGSPKALPAPAKAARPSVRKRRSRPSEARTLLGQKPGKAASDG